MSPIFRLGQLARFADAMVACARRDADTWRDGDVVDMARETTRITMSVAGKTLFGADTFTEADELGAALTETIAWSGRQVTSWLPITQIALRDRIEQAATGRSGRLADAARALSERLQGPVLLLREEDRRMRDAVTILERRVQRMIDDRRAEGTSHDDLLGRLLGARDDDDGAVMTDKQVRDEVLTLFVAGHETTASALAWAMYLLVRHPEIYKRVQADADALGGPARYEDLPRLGLATRVFKEALRLYASLPMFSRDVRTEVEIDGYRLPVGTVVILCPYATHRRADLWPDPDRFDPDRFTPEAEAARPKHAYVPFSSGPRVCIGNHFALMEAPLVITTLLQRADFTLEGVTEVEPDVKATLRPRGGVPMRVRLRRGAGA